MILQALSAQSKIEMVKIMIEINAPISVKAYSERFLLKEPFVISRYSFLHSQMMVVELSALGHIGRGECEPHEYDENILNKAVDFSNNFAHHFANGMDNERLNQILPSGPIRNAFDCALWDLAAKISGKRVWELANIPKPKPLPTVFTLSIDEPENMAQKAQSQADWERFKIKLAGDNCELDIKRVAAIRATCPDAQLIVDANGAWSIETLSQMSNALADLGVLLIEQPILDGKDFDLINFKSAVPLCADESCLDCSSLPYILGRYQYINIKLDKTGGLTEAFKLASAANELGFGLMVGCMAATSLAMAPAHLIAQNAQFIDLDGPMLLKNDRENGMLYEKGLAHYCQISFWG
jgi:L-Ala-D/L-Glu epimerase